MLWSLEAEDFSAEPEKPGFLVPDSTSRTSVHRLGRRVDITSLAQTRAKAGGNLKRSKLCGWI